MYGIDVAESDGSVNWAAVRNSGKTFAIVKATEGKTIKDSTFARNWPTIKQYGMIRGAYHFFHLGSDAKDQANEFLKTVGKIQPGDLPPVLDVEVTDGADSYTVVYRMKQWLAVVEQAIAQQTGKKIKPIVYTYPNFWNETLADPSDFRDYPLWIANYDVQEPDVPESWGQGNWLIHQYAGDVENVAGVSEQADLNRFNSFELGMRGSSIVKSFQQRLKDLKRPEFDPGNVDGNFASVTKKAVIAFQKSKNLQADGIVGIKTWVQLLWA